MIHSLDYLVVSILEQVTVNLGQKCMIINWLCETLSLCNGPESPVWVYVYVHTILVLPCNNLLSSWFYLARFCKTRSAPSLSTTAMNLVENCHPMTDN